jgi:hypothetical protein
MTDLATHIKPLVEAVNAAQAEFERKHADLLRHAEGIERFEKCRDASRSQADEENIKLRGLFKVFAAPKEALKHQAARNGYLEDADNFQALADEQGLAKKACALELNKLASSVRDTRRAVRSAAIEYLRGALIGHMPGEFFQLVQLISESAAYRESALFNTDPTVSEPIEFALREVLTLIRTAVMSNRDTYLGYASLLPSTPPSMGQFNLSPVQIHLLEQELDAEASK